MSAPGPAATDAPVRVAVVDDHDLFRAGVRAELGEAVDVVGDAAGVEEAVALIRERTPEVVLLDVHMPGGGGVEVIRRVLAEPLVGGAAPPRFLALSVSDAVDDVIAVIRSGARGYVTKTISATELTDAVARVAEGDAVFSPRLAGFVLDAFARPEPSPQDPGLDQLTAREREVLRHIARGYSVQGDRAASRYLGQDRGVARLGGAAQAAAVQPPRAEPLGARAAARQPRRVLTAADP